MFTLRTTGYSAGAARQRRLARFECGAEAASFTRRRIGLDRWCMTGVSGRIRTASRARDDGIFLPIAAEYACQMAPEPV